jgi:NAD-dependent dihydropyrimidine dehydrogenase PreA subunit
MPHCIAEPCIGNKCAACVAVCPVEAIHPAEEEEDFDSVEMLCIDRETCIDCGLCVDECPVEAIFLEDELPEKWQKYIELNASYSRNR